MPPAGVYDVPQRCDACRVCWHPGMDSRPPSPFVTDKQKQFLSPVAWRPPLQITLCIKNRSLTGHWVQTQSSWGIFPRKKHPRSQKKPFFCKKKHLVPCSLAKACLQGVYARVDGEPDKLPRGKRAPVVCGAKSKSLFGIGNREVNIVRARTARRFTERCLIHVSGPGRPRQNNHGGLSTFPLQ